MVDSELSDESVDRIFRERQAESYARLTALKERLGTLDGFELDPSLVMFCSGSFARGEASPHSDLDLFFVRAKHPTQESSSTPRTDEYRLFGRLIEIADELGFPSFTDDCKYLKVHNLDNIVQHLGSSLDDYQNYFTVRMLLLLESRCILGSEQYLQVKETILGSYYVDYHDHELTFRPTFLINDISRFWKTLLLNYENSRHQRKRNDCHEKSIGGTDEQLEIDRIKAKIRNFKLKFSRLTTCFATVAAIGIHTPPVDRHIILDIVERSPHERLQSLIEQFDQLEPAIRNLRRQYAHFLQYTALTQEELFAHFKDKTALRDLFSLAEEYRWSAFKLLQQIDEHACRSNSAGRGLIDTLVI